MVKHQKLFLITSFIAYLFVAFWIFFFKAGIGKDLVFFVWDATFNWVPFSEIFRPDGISYVDVCLQILNIIGFIPVGFYAAGLFKKGKLVFGTLVSLAFTIFIEVLQYFLKFGRGQLDDLITNLLGGFLGALIYILIYKKVSSKTQTIFYMVSTCIFACLIILGVVVTSIKWQEYTTLPPGYDKRLDIFVNLLSYLII